MKPIDLDSYRTFIKGHFEEGHRKITDEVIEEVYQMFEGTTWYIHFMMNFLYSGTLPGETCTMDRIELAQNEILSQMSYTYSSLLYQLQKKKKEVLMAICKVGKVKEITSSKFLKTRPRSL